jgi:hypothetical protein
LADIQVATAKCDAARDVYQEKLAALNEVRAKHRQISEQIELLNGGELINNRTWLV